MILLTGRYYLYGYNALDCNGIKRTKRFCIFIYIFQLKFWNNAYRRTVVNFGMFYKFVCPMLWQSWSGTINTSICKCRQDKKTWTLNVYLGRRKAKLQMVKILKREGFPRNGFKTKIFKKLEAEQEIGSLLLCWSWMIIFS